MHNGRLTKCSKFINKAVFSVSLFFLSQKFYLPLFVLWYLLYAGESHLMIEIFSLLEHASTVVVT